jgi:hypothetical protein
VTKICKPQQQAQSSFVRWAANDEVSLKFVDGRATTFATPSSIEAPRLESYRCIFATPSSIEAPRLESYRCITIWFRKATWY